MSAANPEGWLANIDPDEKRIDYFEQLDRLHAKRDEAKRTLTAARELNAPIATQALWERIVAADNADIIRHRDRRTVQQPLAVVEQHQEAAPVSEPETANANEIPERCWPPSTNGVEPKERL